ncbi:MAG: hypothetical protein ACR2RD_01780 [Woeseiaceae bacterium]
MKSSFANVILAAKLVCVALILGGCSGTKVLKEPQPLQATQPLATVADHRLGVTLDWVIVRDGPGTWAKNADWDEYLLSVKNLSGEPITVTELTVVDSIGTSVGPEQGRKRLVKGSKKTSRRYKELGIKVKAGRGAGTMLVAGAAVTAVGYGAASAVAYGSLASGTAAAGGASAAAGGLLLLGPALAVGGVVRGLRNSAVNSRIEQRQTGLPISLLAGEEQLFDVFFPLAPSPQTVALLYTDASGDHSLVIDTREALQGLHIDGARP